MRFRDKSIMFASGSAGVNIAIPSASPANYHQVIAEPEDMPTVTLDGKLFIPSRAKRVCSGKLPLVIVVPGSLGIAPSHVAHAETLTNNGIAAFVLDNFGGRDVTSTVADQTQFSFAASAYDVLATWAVLSAHPEIDDTRIGAQGHSRGGSAVLTAATRRFADAVVGKGRGLVGILAAYPWCGHQFLDPRVGTTEVHVLMGDADEWCSPMQAQGYVQAIRLAGANASIRLFAGAQHSFDRGTAIVDVPDASVAPGAPTAYLSDDGAFIHPAEVTPNSALTDRDLMIYGMKAGFGRTGAKIGSRDGDDKLFRDNMVAFWRRVMTVGAVPREVDRP
jgi:dienelactone hydrolase